MAWPSDVAVALAVAADWAAGGRCQLYWSNCGVFDTGVLSDGALLAAHTDLSSISSMLRSTVYSGQSRAWLRAKSSVLGGRVNRRSAY